MPAFSLKKIIAKVINKIGYQIHKIQSQEKNNNELKLSFNFDHIPGTQNRPIGDVNTFLNDLKERKFICRYVFDIGSNRNDYSRMIKKTFPDANFLLIDPLIEMEVHMKNFCNEFKDSKYLITGVGSGIEKKILTTIGDSLEGSTMMLKEIPRFKRNNKQREVEVVTVDSLIQDDKNNFPDLVKIDVQGSNLRFKRDPENYSGKPKFL